MLRWAQLRQQLQRERGRGVDGGKETCEAGGEGEMESEEVRRKKRCWQSERRRDERKREWAAGDAFSADAQRTAGLLCTCFCPCLISIARMMHAHAQRAGVTTHTHTGLKGRTSFELPPFVSSGCVCNYSPASDEQHGKAANATANLGAFKH